MGLASRRGNASVDAQDAHSILSYKTQTQTGVSYTKNTLTQRMGKSSRAGFRQDWIKGLEGALHLSAVSPSAWVSFPPASGRISPPLVAKTGFGSSQFTFFSFRLYVYLTRIYEVVTGPRSTGKLKFTCLRADVTCIKTFTRTLSMLTTDWRGRR